MVTKEVDYEYDVFNRRVSKSIDADGAGPGAAEVTRFVYDGGDILAITDASGGITHRMLHGPAVDQILAIEEDATGEVLWGLTDHLGSIRDIVDNDGNVENHIVYDAFGNVVSETAAAVDFLYGFTGRERDEESGLNYHRARYYDTATGRWLSNDPIGFAAGDTNIQRYVGNNPVNYVDPSGLVGEPIEVSISIDVDSGGMWSPPPQQGRTWGQWLLGTGGDWLDRNYGGGQYGDPDITGRILHAYSDLSTLLPGGGEIRDVADIVIGIDAAGNRLTPVERGVTVAMLALPVIPTRWVRGPAIDIVDGIIDRVDDTPRRRVFTNTDGPVDLNRPPGSGTSGGFGGTHVTDQDLSDPAVLPPFASNTIPGNIKPRVTEIEVPESGLRPDPTDGGHGTQWIPPNTPGAEIVNEWDVVINDDVFPVTIDIRPRSR